MPPDAVLYAFAVKGYHGLQRKEPRPACWILTFFSNTRREAMNHLKIMRTLVLIVSITTVCSSTSFAWHDETHIAVAKAAGYTKWYNATGADMAKIKAGRVESRNHSVHNAPGTNVTVEMVLSQVERYNHPDDSGHLYGAIIASIRDYMKQKRKGKYGEYHLAFCAHYVGDLSQPLHNTPRNMFNRKYHKTIDGIIDDEVFANIQEIKTYPITVDSEEALAKEISRIANLSMKLGFKIEAENRPLTKEEAYIQIGHSVSLLKAILEYVDAPKMNDGKS
jgi:hypothetical protein